jgi:serine protease Do
LSPKRKSAKKVPVTLWRKGSETTLTVELGQMEQTAQAAGEKPAQPAAAAPAAQEIAPLGMTVAPLDETLRLQHGLPETLTGVVVISVATGGAAAERGIAAGDLIVEIDQQESGTPEAVAQKVAEAQKAGRSSVLLFVARREDRRFVALKLK